MWIKRVNLICFLSILLKFNLINAKPEIQSLNKGIQSHANQISSYVANLRKVPLEKFKYHYCNKFCKDVKQLDYNESENATSSSAETTEFTQCFHNYSEQKFCDRPMKCSKGFFANHNNTICVKLNECEEKLDDCLPQSEYCVNHYDGYTCECKSGYKYDLYTIKCINIDECAENDRICPSDSHCKDLDGSYECNCLHGLIKNEFGQCISKNFPKNFSKNYKNLFPILAPKTQEINTNNFLLENLLDKKNILGKLKEQEPKGRKLNRNESKEGELKVDKFEKKEPEKKDRLNRNGLKRDELKEDELKKDESKEEKLKKDEFETKKSKEENEFKIEELKGNEFRMNESKKNKTNANKFTRNYPKMSNNLCPDGYFLSSHMQEKCIDIDECSNSTLNNCKENQTCINLPGTYKCRIIKEECSKDINLNLYTNDLHRHDQHSTRASTYVFLLILICFIIFIAIVFMFTYFVYKRFSYNYDLDT